MPRFCIVVKSPDEELFRALEEVFLGRPEFSVVRERRVRPPAGPWPRDRRTARVWETDGLQFSETCDE